MRVSGQRTAAVVSAVGYPQFRRRLLGAEARRGGRAGLCSG
eukprot:SAG11_NODE_830_length_6956_cov_11.233484_2_plen_41_part_00